MSRPRPLADDPGPAAGGPLAPISGPLRTAARAVGSATALAAASGVDVRTVSRWLRGAKDVTLATADRLAVALRLQVGPAAPTRRTTTRPGTAPRPAPMPLAPAAEPGPDAHG